MKKNKEIKFKYNKDNLIKLISLWKESLEQGDKYLTNFKEKVGKMFFNKEITHDDILQLQEEGFPKNVFIDLVNYITVNPETGIVYIDALDLARNWHIALLNMMKKDSSDFGASDVRKTFPKYEKMVDDIYAGLVPEEELSIIKQLPSWKEDYEEVQEQSYKIFKGSVLDKK